MKEYWQQTKEELQKEYPHLNQGYSKEEVEKAREKYGENVLEEGTRKSVLAVFLSQFCDLLVVILVIAAIISMFSKNVESTIVIFAVLIMNGILGTIQHLKAQKSLDSLKQLSSPSAKAIRDGVKQEIASKDIVPGDIVLLEAGDMVVADGRILHNYSLQVNESSLTGESTNVDKNEEVLVGEVPLADRTNMVFSGSLVTYGRAEILITGTGMNTEMGKIAGLMNDTKERKTPLQVSLDQFSKRLAIMIMVICVIVFGLCIYRDMPLIDSLMFAVALAVAAIPEALSSIVTIVQAIGTQKMASQNAIMKELKAVESLGCVSVICSDKTGTLTQNKMTVKQVYVGDEILLPKQLNIMDKEQRYLLYNAILNNDSSINEGKGIGDPTEYALLEMFRQIEAKSNSIFKAKQITEEAIRELMTRLEEVPFDSDRKLMSSKYAIHGEDTVLTKGAVDVLIDRCDYIIKDGEKEPLTKEEKEKIKQVNQSFSENGLRVLAFAYKATKETLSLETETGYIFSGLIAMIDPPRPESVQAVADAKRAGIRPVMITGDHKITAVAIAKEIGIYKEQDMAVTGSELDAMSDEELFEKIERISVYARVSPENKIRIVDMWQKKGHIVSMTGDGVNDAPALKKADIGVAMGITGTEVSKDAAAMILSDDNFATIMKAVANGRNIYRNIKNAILFLLSGNMAGILSVLYTSIMALPVPFAPVHLLFINLLTDSLPAIAIGMEPSDKTLLLEQPRNPKTGILTKDFVWKVFAQGGLIAIATMIAFYIGLDKNSVTASTMAFATLTLARLFHGFNCRNRQSIFRLKLHTNPFSIYAFFGGAALLSLVIFVPGLHSLFSVVTLNAKAIWTIIALAISPTIFIQLIKVILDHKKLD